MPTAKGPKGRKHHNADDDDMLEPEVTMPIGFPTVVVVDNTPIAPESKFAKLESVLFKFFNEAIGPVVQLSLPKDDKGNTKGFAFVEFETEEAAQAAIEKADGYKLDKNHIFRVQSYEDFQRYEKVQEEYIPPQLKPFEPRPNLRSWLMTEAAVDQYCIRYQDLTEVLWNDLKQGEEPTTVEKRAGWTETYASWSPRGTYLLTIYPAKGVAIWGGPSFEKLMRFAHAGVKLIDFSPCEKFLVTASPQFQENDNPKDPQCIIVWDVRSGEKLRGFLGGQTSSWPVFKWSHDDKYFARMSTDTISVYDTQTPELGLLDKKSVKVAGVKDFLWSPSDNIISYFVPEASEKPATVVLLEIPSKKEKRQKNLFNVKDCKMHWHPSGDFLGVKVDRMSKSKKTFFTNFELFRMREKEIPIELIELKDSIVAFAWEPKGTKFAIIHGDSARPDVSFYNMEEKGHVKLLKTLEKKAANNLFWSPQGNYIVLAGLGPMNGQLEFFNANDMETLGTEEHIMSSVIDWDPSGRYVSSVVSFWRHQMENGYNIYSFTGKLQKHVLKDKFYQLVWRPRPPSLISEEKQKHVVKNIRQYALAFKARDREKKEKVKAERKAIRSAKREAFLELLARKREQYKQQNQERKEILGADSDEESINWKEEWVEEVEEYQEVVLE